MSSLFHDTPERDHYAPPASILLEVSRGHWRAILTDIGIPAEAIDGRRGRPCPKCGGRDRFSPLPLFNERGAVICRKCFGAGDDPRPGDGIATLRWWIGCEVKFARQWLAEWHGLVPGQSVQYISRPIIRRVLIPAACQRDWSDDSTRWHQWLVNRPNWLQRVAERLALPIQPIVRLGVGWATEFRATTWPMRDADGRVTGVRLRCPKTCRKWAVTGSRAGLIYPRDLISQRPVERLYVCEGPSDAAALLSIELTSVGVPSAGGATDLLAAMAGRLGVNEVIVVADSDGPGRAGAERLADALQRICPVRVITPPDRVKDAREWVLAGANRSAIEAAISDAPVRTLSIARSAR